MNITIGAKEIAEFFDMHSCTIRSVVSKISHEKQTQAGIYKNITGWQIPAEAIKYEPLLKIASKRNKTIQDLEKFIFEKYKIEKQPEPESAIKKLEKKCEFLHNEKTKIKADLDEHTELMQALDNQVEDLERYIKSLGYMHHRKITDITRKHFSELLS